METGKLCIDIGGTKTLFAIINKSGILKSKKVDTPKSKEFFLEVIKKEIEEYLPISNGIINVSVAGRLNNNGNVIFCPNLPILGFNLMNFLHGFSKNVNIENDGNCFGLYHLHNGDFKGAKSGFAVVWGTGIGSSIIYQNNIYKGAGIATESGHIIADYKNGKDIEDLIGGRAIKRLYNMDGFEMHKLAESGNETAISNFRHIGKLFGYYLSSLCLVLDPQVIILGGSFANSWKFMKYDVNEVLREKLVRKKIKIKIAKGKFYVIRGAYFIDGK